MPPPVQDHDHDGDPYQEIEARAPQLVTAPPTAAPSLRVSISTTNTSPFPPDLNITTPAQASHTNSIAVKTIIEYFFLIMALFIASIFIFRRLFYLRRRDPYNNHGAPHIRRPFTFHRTTGFPRIYMGVGGGGYPRSHRLPAQPVPAASRRTRSDDIDLDGCRFTSVGTEVDHDGLLRDKDVLPKYETLGAPPKYSEAVTPSTPVPPPPLPAARSPRIMSAEAETPPIQSTSPSPQD